MRVGKVCVTIIVGTVLSCAGSVWATSAMVRLTPGPAAKWTQTLSGAWEFSPPDQKKFYPSQVPGVWTENVPGANYNVGCNKWLTGTYRREFTVPQGTTGVAVEFDSIRWGGEVLVNGKSVGKHDLAFAPVAFDITRAIKPGKNLIEVKPVGWKAVERFETGDPVIPCGAAHWFGNKLGGITGEVTLRLYDGARVSAARVVPRSKGPACEVIVEVTAGNADWKGFVAVRILNDARTAAVSGVVQWPVTVKANTTATVTVKNVRAPGAKLWWPESPVMHRAVVWLEAEGKGPQAANVREETFGFRDVRVEKGRFLLNGRRIALFGYSGVWIYGNFDFMRDSGKLRNHQVVLFRAMNAKAFRCHQDPMARKWIDLCDREGILIACEFPNFPDMQRLPKWSLDSPYDRPRFVENLKRDIRGMVANRFNHPSIVIWSATNEGNGFSDWERANLLPFVKSVDTTRPVMFSSDITDTIADHHNFADLWYGTYADFERIAVDLKERYPDHVVGCSEFGQFGKSYRFYGRGMKQVPREEHVRVHAQLLMEHIETFRRLRYDLIMPFCYPAGRQAVESGKVEDTGEKFAAMRNALAPLGVVLDFPRRHLLTNSPIDVPVHLLSDDESAKGSAGVEVMILAKHPGFKWDGKTAGLAVARRRTFTTSVRPWEAKKEVVRLATPAREGAYTLAAVLKQKGEVKAISLRPLRVYEPLGAPKKKLTVGVVETDGKLAKWLKARGHEVVMAYGAKLPDVIVVGEGHMTDARLRGYGFQTYTRIKEGGARLVFLEQQAWNPGGLARKMCEGLVSTPLRVAAQQVFPETDVIREAVGGNLDFRRLSGYDNIGLRVRLEVPQEKPTAGKTLGTGQPDDKAKEEKKQDAAETRKKNPWRPLMAAFTRGLKRPDWALVYRRFGAGEVFACQIPLTGRVDRADAESYDPVAERLLAWLVEGEPLPDDEAPE